MESGLREADPEIYTLIEEEKGRQGSWLELIASENYTSRSVLEALGSVLTNKYSEGLPFKRYYGGNAVIDKIETLCIERALTAFHLNDEEWGVNVQPLSGSSANFAVYTGVLSPGDRIMGLDLSSGGHLTHGHRINGKNISASAKYFQSLTYGVNKDGLVDYDDLEKLAQRFYPKMIICGGSSYPREWDYRRLKDIADKIGAYLMCDMAHTSGLIASGELETPFAYCDIVTTTTQKTMRGPRAGLAFFRKKRNGEDTGLENKVNSGVFPACQGGPHNNTIAAVAVALKQLTTKEFEEYSKKVVENAKTLSRHLVDIGYNIVTGGTDNHILLVDLRDKGVSGSKVEKTCEHAQISINKNTVPGDKSMISPGGIRLGTAALTSKGMVESDMQQIASFLDETVKIAFEIQSEAKSTLMKDFITCLERNEKVKDLRNRVNMFARKFSIPSELSKNE